MFLPSFCYPPGFLAKRAQREKEAIQQRLTACVDWSPDIKWQPQLNLRAESYTTLNLFPECHIITTNDVNSVKDPGITSPSGSWLYCVKRLQRGVPLTTWYGWKTGNVVFDGPIFIPSLHQKWRNNSEWKEAPWMSFTPAEVISMRGGTKRAKGSVIVAGLGLGHQLIEVSRRKQVTKLILVEKEQELVDWILPRILPHLGRKLDDIIVGDAYEEMPKLTADVGLVDIFSGYGGNDSERDKLRRTCKSIGYIWCWGAAQLKESGWQY